jgi:hypothetical protein
MGDPEQHHSWRDFRALHQALVLNPLGRYPNTCTKLPEHSAETLPSQPRVKRQFQGTKEAEQYNLKRPYR